MTKHGYSSKRVQTSVSKRLTREYDPELTTILAKVGDVNGKVWVSNRPGYIHARAFDGSYLQAYSEIRDLKYNQLVRLGTTQANKRVFKVLEIWSAQGRALSPHLESHGSDHSLGGRDVVSVWLGQIMWWNAQPIRGSLSVKVYCPPRMKLSGEILPPEIRELDLSVYTPPVGGYYLLVEVLDGQPQIVQGDTYPDKNLLSLDAIPPASPGAFRLAAFAYYGQSAWVLTTTWSDFVDLRLSDYGWSSWDRVSDKPSEFEPKPYSDYYTISSLETHRIVSDGGTIYEMPDFVERIISVYDNSLRIDPIEISLSDDYSQMILNTGPTVGHVLVVEYIPLRN